MQTKELNIETEFLELQGQLESYLDRVSGYTVKQLEDGLRGAKSWTDWRNNIKARHNNSTESFVDELFNNWE